jgi:hypothetical protein
MPTQSFYGIQLTGDNTAGRILRALRLTFLDGVGATISPYTEQWWNGDVIGQVTNLAKSASSGGFSLSADGKTLTILSTSISGDALVAMGTIYTNNFGVAITSVTLDISAGGISVRLGADNDQAFLDLTAVKSGGHVQIVIWYITSA